MDRNSAPRILKSSKEPRPLTQLFQLGKNIMPLATYLTRIFNLYTVSRSRGRSVSIVSDYGLDDRVIGVQSLAGAKDFSSILCIQTGSGIHPASCTMGTRGPFPGGKARPGRDADHSSHLVPSRELSSVWCESMFIWQRSLDPCVLWPGRELNECIYWIYPPQGAYIQNISVLHYWVQCTSRARPASRKSNVVTQESTQPVCM
jgi:hypothetical protein